MGAAPFEGDLGIEALNAPIVDMASTPSHQGYWLVPSDGGVFSFDDAAFSGSLGGHALTTTVAAAMSDPAGGYRLVSSARTGVPFGAPTFPAPPGGGRDQRSRPVHRVTGADGRTSKGPQDGRGPPCCLRVPPTGCSTGLPVRYSGRRKTRTPVKLPDDLDAHLRHEAERRAITVSALTREAIEERLGARRGRRRCRPDLCLRRRPSP